MIRKTEDPNYTTMSVELTVLLTHSSDLLHSICPCPIGLVHKLVSCAVLTDETVSRCHTNESNYVKASCIVLAVRENVRVNGKESFVKFVKAMNEEPALQPVVKKLLATYERLGGNTT